MPVTINGDGSITGLAVGGLPNGSVDADSLASNAVTSTKLATNAVTTNKIANGAATQAKRTYAAGEVIQVKKTVITVPTGETMSTGYQVVGNGFEITITPTSASNHIYLMGHINMESHQQYCSLKFGRYIGGVESNPAGFNGQQGGSNQVSGWSGNLYRAGNHDSYGNTNQPFNLVDTDHNTTNAITYKLQVTNSSGAYSVFFNRTHTDSNTTYSYRAVSTIIAMEIQV